MKIALFAESSNANYFAALNYLMLNNKIKLIKYSYSVVPEIIKYLIKKNKFNNISINNNYHNIAYKPRFYTRLLNFLNNKEYVYDIFMHPFRIIKCLDSDIFIMACSPYHPYIYLFFLLKLLRRKTIFSTSWPFWEGNRCPYESNFLTKYLWKAYLNNQIVHTVNKNATTELKKIMNAKTFYIPHCVDTKVFNIQRAEHNNIRILYVGRLELEKGITELVKYIEDNNNRSIELWIIGEGSLKQFIIEKSKYLNINYLGYIANKIELAKIYNKCDIFSLPSFSTKKWEELFGISILEAMCCGLPVVATNSVGPSELITHKLNGFLVEQNNYKELKKYLDMLVDSPKLRFKIGNNAHKSCNIVFSIINVSNRWLALFKDENISLSH